MVSGRAVLTRTKARILCLVLLLSLFLAFLFHKSFCSYHFLFAIFFALLFVVGQVVASLVLVLLLARWSFRTKNVRNIPRIFIHRLLAIFVLYDFHLLIVFSWLAFFGNVTNLGEKKNLFTLFLFFNLLRLPLFLLADGFSK